MAIERTLSIIKPDATRRNLTGAINAKIEGAGLRIIAQKRVKWEAGRRDLLRRPQGAPVLQGPREVHDLGPDRHPGARGRQCGRQLSRRDGRHQSRPMPRPAPSARNSPNRSRPIPCMAPTAPKMPRRKSSSASRPLRSSAERACGSSPISSSIVLVNWLFVAVAPWSTPFGDLYLANVVVGLRLRAARLCPARDRPQDSAGDACCRHHHLFHGRSGDCASPASPPSSCRR